MGVFRHILVATDFSEQARPAVELGAKLARALGSRVTLMHAIGLPVGGVPMVGIAAGSPSKQECDDRLAELERELFADLAHVKREVMAQQSPATSIVKRAEDLSVDLVVVGTHGHNALSAFFIGSVAENVARHAPCSVLVAREPVLPLGIPRRLLAATDFSGAAAIGVAKARELALALDAQVTLAHVFVEPSPLSLGKRFLYQASDELLDSLRDELANVARSQLSGVPKVGCELLRGKQAASTLCSHAAEHDHDMIVVTAQGHSALEHMLIGSVSEKVVRHAPCSVLVLRPSG